MCSSDLELLDKTDPVVRHLLMVVLERFRSSRDDADFDPTRRTLVRDVHTPQIATRHLVLSHEITEAMKQEQFELFYQPICELATGRIAGFEALIRWQHPALGVISPLEFLWLAEQTGQIRDIGLWSLERACVDWPVLRAQSDHPTPFVSVNLSPSQLTDTGLVDQVSGILARHHLPVSALKIGRAHV